MNLGRLRLGQGDLPAAAALYQQAVNADHPEESPRAMLMMGYLLEEAGDDEGAISWFEAGVSTGHHFWGTGASAARGADRLRHDDLVGASEDFARATHSSNAADAARAWILLGITRGQLGDRAGAIEAYRVARDDGPPDIAAQAAQQLRLFAPIRG